MLTSSLHRIGNLKEAISWQVKGVNFAIRLLKNTENLEEKIFVAQNLEKMLDFLMKAEIKLIVELPESDQCELVNSVIDLLVLLTESPPIFENFDSDLNEILNLLNFWSFLILYKISAFWEEFSEWSPEYAKFLYQRVNPNKILLGTRSLMILRRGHEEFGRKKICTKNQGKFLFFFAQEILRILKNSKISNEIPTACVDDMLNEAEQCIFCLFQHPQKRKRHLVDHFSSPVEIKWKNSSLIFEFFKPEEENLPEFDGTKANTVSAEMENLLKRIEAVIPENFKPNSVVGIVDDFLCGKLPKIPKIPKILRWTEVTGELYHLLADYYLKSQEYLRSAEYYQLDLCLNPERFDSWGGLALVRSRCIYDRLHSVKFSLL